MSVNYLESQVNRVEKELRKMADEGYRGHLDDNQTIEDAANIISDLWTELDTSLSVVKEYLSGVPSDCLNDEDIVALRRLVEDI